mgnify:CR=1 FL=1
MIYFIGDGGHAKVCKEIAAEDWQHRSDQRYTFIAVGDNASRKTEAAGHPRPFAVLIHPSASISTSATYGQGCVFMEGSVIQAESHLGEHVIVNAGAVITHHCTIGNYAHIAPGAHLCGGVHVGEGALIGVGVGIEPGVKIPAWSIVKRIPYVISLPDHQTA